MLRRLAYIFSALILLAPSTGFAASFSLSPTAPTLGSGCSGSVRIWINAAGDPVNAGNAIIQFDASKVKNVKLTPGSFFESYVDNVVSGSQARLTGFSVSSAPTGSGLFATLGYTAVSPGPATFSFAFAPGSSTDSNIASALTSDDLLTSASSGTVTITNDPCPVAPKPAPKPPASASPAPGPTADSCAASGCTTDIVCFALPESEEPRPALDCAAVASEPFYTMTLPHSTVTESRFAGEETPFFSAFQKRAGLPRDGSVYTAVQRLTVTVTAADRLFKETPREVQLLVDNTQYVASRLLDEDASELTFQAPEKPGIYTAALVFFYEDKTREVWPFYLRVLERGAVSGIVPSDRLLADVRVTLQQADGEPWVGSVYGQENPLALRPDEDRYVFLAPVGSYRLKAEFSGYPDVFTPVFETEGFVTVPLAFVAPLGSSESTIGGYAIGRLNNLRYDPGVERAMNRLMLLLTGLALVLTALFARHHRGYLRHLFWSLRLLRFCPRLLGERGMLYNTKNKGPVSRALVRVFDGSSGVRLLAGFSDKSGVVAVYLPKGVYRFRADAVGYRVCEGKIEQGRSGLWAPKVGLEPRHSTRLEFGYPYATIWFIILVGVAAGVLASAGVVSIERTPLAVGLLVWYVYLAGLAHMLLRRHRVG